MVAWRTGRYLNMATAASVSASSSFGKADEFPAATWPLSGARP